MNIIAYHGTDHNIDEFSNSFIGTKHGGGHYGSGLYFSPSKKFASYYGKILYTVKLTLNNPYVHVGSPTQLKKDIGLITPDMKGIIRVHGNDVMNKLKSEGYDSVIVKNDTSDEINEIVVYDASDIEIINRELLTTAITEGSDATDNLQPDSQITVYHGTNNAGMKEFLTKGIDATRIHHRHYNQGNERGIYVTDDFKLAGHFGNWIIEFIAQGKQLFPTAKWGYGGSARKNMLDYFSTKYPNSFRPVVSSQLREPVEPQAMFIGYVPLSSIVKIYNYDYSEEGQPIKEYTVDEAKKILAIYNPFNWNESDTIEDIIQILANKFTKGNTHKVISILRNHDDIDGFYLPRKLELRLKEYLKSQKSTQLESFIQSFIGYDKPLIESILNGYNVIFNKL